MTDRLRTAVIGVGSAGKDHAERTYLRADFVLAGLADPQVERLRAEWADRGVPCYADYRELLERERPDAVIVASPHHLHHEHATAALATGAHVLVEKPMAMTAGHCAAMVAAATRAGRQLMVAHTLHYYPATRLARRLIEEGRIGTVVGAIDERHTAYATADRPRWYLGGEARGMFFNLGVHSLDRCRWLVGSVERTVTARLVRRAGVDLGGTALVTYANGVSATIVLSGFCRGEGTGVTVLGEAGMVRATFTGVELNVGSGFEAVELTDREEPGEVQLRAFAESIRTGRPAETDGVWGRAVVAAAEAVYESDRTGRTVSVAAAGQ